MELFTFLGPSLKRLVIDMPLRSHYPEEDIIDKLRPLLRKGFEQLIHLEEFCSVRDELYLAYWDPTFSQQAHDDEVNDFVFEKWTKLRRLALYNQMLDDNFRTALSHMANLETVVLSRPDYDSDLRLDDLILQFEVHVKVIVIDATDDAAQARMRKMLTDTDPSRTRSDAWELEILICEDKNPISAVQEWSLQSVLEGTLWALHV
ncbi:unnamed protein product [Aureobasidium vineae]|uniref:Uncharacterized protein n=1 Tax=Aureobasidium vineae TaxID=2773715 RepID=A0A9N8PEN8_9PEZI|nr:unnamed protein product [Aureobasidium vineae]